METTNNLKHAYVINKHCVVQPCSSIIILYMQSHYHHIHLVPMSSLLQGSSDLPLDLSDARYGRGARIPGSLLTYDLSSCITLRIPYLLVLHNTSYLPKLIRCLQCILWSVVYTIEMHIAITEL